jgi:hypothetical protein
MSMLNLVPTRTKALNNIVSPIVKPMNPDNPNQNQTMPEAPIGKSLPNTITWVIIRSIRVRASLVRFTTLAPISLPATVKKIGPIDQHKAVPNAAISPIFLIKVL